MFTPEKGRQRGCVTVSAVDELLRSQARRPPTVELPVERAAGRVLAEDLHADRDFPAFDRVAMDGIAIRYDAAAAGRRSFLISGAQRAGEARCAIAEDGDCVEVMTGAPLPFTADCVVRIEDTTREGERIVLKDGAKVERFRNVDRQGVEHRAGAPLVRAGRRITPPVAAVCAAIGKSVVRVVGDPKIAVIATGDELAAVEAAPRAYEIRSSNQQAIASALRLHGFSQVTCGSVTDDPVHIAVAASSALDSCDLLILTGGVSAGGQDEVPATLASLGIAELVHGVLQRPGLPFLLAVSPEGKAVFALPGNPVPALICAVRYVIPYLALCATGEWPPIERVALARDLVFEPRLTLFKPVRLARAADGQLAAIPAEVQGSGDLTHLAESDGFVELAADLREFPAGSRWPLYRWSGLYC